jgi:hypothetical protein
MFPYSNASGLFVGWQASVRFTIDAPREKVWPFFKDFNLWQNPYGYYYSRVIGNCYRKATTGELGEERLSITVKADGKPDEVWPYEYQVLKVIPEHLIVMHQPVAKDGANGGVSMGFHVFMLGQQGGKTEVMIEMEHLVLSDKTSEIEAVEAFQTIASEGEGFWLTIFIPTLKSLVARA